MPTTRVELKYCEGCGALRLRAAQPMTAPNAAAIANDSIYCAACARLLAARPARKAASGAPEGGRK